jgi:uncharacterized protein
MLLREHQAELQQLGVEHLYLFGATARDQAGAVSDVDLLFDHPRRAWPVQLMDVKAVAARILGNRTEIMIRASLHRVLRPQIEASAVKIF